MRALYALVLLAAVPAGAVPVVVSPAPTRVAVTVYRDPGRAANARPDLDAPTGFALVTERREVELPAGDVELRFEGVAGAIEPASAILTGLPGDVREKNRDARLLTPAGLVDAGLGGQVTIRRTDAATGRVREEPAVLRAGPDEGVVVQTASGIEALRCSGLPETLIFPRVADGLVARPTLSVRAHAKRAGRATVTLSYLAGRFDWAASYVADLSADGRTLDLSAWLTLVNANGESFVEAETQAVAGRLVHAPSTEEEGQDGGLHLRCWPGETTSDVGSGMPPSEPVPPPMMMAPAPMAEIVVTGSRLNRMTAVQEALGDLKLYRVPERVTVAANAQKQVGLLDRQGVPVDRVYRGRINASGAEAAAPMAILLRTRNLPARHLGLPLPAGRLALFAQGEAGRRGLVAEASLDDRAIGELVEIPAGTSAQVRLAREATGARGHRLIVANAQSTPVAIEVALPLDEEAVVLRNPSARLERRNGELTWIASVPANGRAVLRYDLVERR